MDSSLEPLARTDNANRKLTIILVLVSLVMLVFGNNDMTRNWQIAGTDASGALNNIGLATLIAAITQYYTDFKVRSKFYKDISDHIVANGSLRDSGILKFFEDSKDCIPKSMLKSCNSLDIGITYSDRFLKDNLSHITKHAEKMQLRVFYSDLDDADVLRTISHNIGISESAIFADYKKLSTILDQIERSGVKITRYKNKHMPHYSFYAIDNQHFFLTMSTFASRRSTVPLFQVDQSSPIASLIKDDMQHIISENPEVN